MSRFHTQVVSRPLRTLRNSHPPPSSSSSSARTWSAWSGLADNVAPAIAVILRMCCCSYSFLFSLPPFLLAGGVVNIFHLGGSFQKVKTLWEWRMGSRQQATIFRPETSAALLVNRRRWLRRRLSFSLFQLLLFKNDSEHFERMWTIFDPIMWEGDTNNHLLAMLSACAASVSGDQANMSVALTSRKTHTCVCSSWMSIAPTQLGQRDWS